MQEPDPERPAEESPGGVAAGPPGEEASWLRWLSEEARSGWQLSATPAEPPALTVTAVERYLAEAPPAAPRYWYDVTLADGAGQERCYLAPRLSRLVQRAYLHAGARVRLTRCSYLYDERRLRRGLYSDCSAGREPARPRGGVTAARGAEGRSEGYGRPAARPAGVNPRAAAIPAAVQLRAPPHRYRRRGRFSLAAAPPSPLRSGTRPPPCFRSADWAAAEISGSRLAFGRVSHGSRGGHT